jgi:hypothetical protein
MLRILLVSILRVSVKPAPLAAARVRRQQPSAAADPLDEGLESNEPPPVAANVSKKRLSGAFRDEDVEDMDIQTSRPNRKKKTPKSLDDYW